MKIDPVKFEDFMQAFNARAGEEEQKMTNDVGSAVASSPSFITATLVVAVKSNGDIVTAALTGVMLGILIGMRYTAAQKMEEAFSAEVPA